MKLSYNWLKDYLKINKSPAELANDLSLFGHEVESMDKTPTDTIFDLEITPNRGDCLSVLGLSREIAALYNLKLKTPKYEIKEEKIDQKIKVTVSDPKICPRYTARIIDHIQIKESPLWLRERLLSYGFRPINNIVDITNYVMVAIGQPLHAFSYDKIINGQMTICQAKGGEELITLDDKKRILAESAIVIKDSQKIYDLAGIMGGLNSEVDENTKTIVLQGAIFDPVLIRRASKKLNLTTDASYRYERGVDFEGTVASVDLAAGLILETCPEAKVSRLIDQKNLTPEILEIDLDIQKVNKLLGIQINKEQAEEDLERLNFTSQIADEILKVKIPSYRAYDVKIWQDLAEEIARIYGYNNIQTKELEKSVGKKDENWLKGEAIKDYLVKTGFTEVYSYSFTDKKKSELLGEDTSTLIEIANPLSPETQYLRPSLITVILDKIAKNPWAPEIAVFEIGKVFSKTGDEIAEKWQLAVVVTGSDQKLKDALAGLSDKVEIKSIDQKILAGYKIRRPILIAIVDLDEIKIERRNIDDQISPHKYREISKYPPTVRDLAFIVEEKVSAFEVKKLIESGSDSILLVELFDEFSSDKFGVGKKNIAFHIWLQDLKKPMAEKEVNETISGIIKEIEIKFKAHLRS